MQKTRGQHSKAALMVRYKTVMLCILILQTWRPPSRAAHAEERPLPSPGGRASSGHTYMDRHLKKLSLARSSKSPRKVCELPGRPSAEGQQHKQRAREQGQGKPTPHPLSVQTPQREALEQPQLAGFHLSRARFLLPFAKCTQCARHSK